MAQTEPMAGAWHCAGNVSPSSDSGLGSEDEQLSGVSAEYEQLAADLSRALAEDAADSEGGEQGGESLSLLLTSANPARIDVRTLRRSKVALSQFQDYCHSHLGSSPSLSPDQDQDRRSHQMSREEEEDTAFCDKKLLAINHLYNDSSEAILSVRGTVRGIKNRVRAGIRTFAPEKIISNAEYGQCVMYVTSLGIVRTTKARCSSVRKILRNLSVRVYERDVFMSATHCHDLKQRLGGAADISLPQVFIHGHLLGDAETVEQLNESGDLRQLLRPFQDPEVVSAVCWKCGGYGMYPCTVCEGSRRSRNLHRGLRCTRCDQGGLMLCDQCN